MIVKKRQLLTATLIIALGAAVAVNWYYTDNNRPESGMNITTTVSVSGSLGDSLLVNGTVAASKSEEESIKSAEYFANARITRNQTNDKIVDKINEISEKTTLTTEDKEKISKLLNEYTKTIKAQSDCENLIKAKTDSECIVIISEDSCQVIMEKNSLNDTVIMQISEIIEKNTNISAENLIIIESK